MFRTPSSEKLSRGQPNVRRGKCVKTHLDYLMGIDLGTSSTKTVILDCNRQVVSLAAQEYGIDRPQPNHAEQDPRSLPEENWGSALVLKNVSDFEIRSFTGRQGLTGKDAPAVLLENISDGLIADSRADTGCKTFVEVSKADSKKVILRNNNTAKASKAVFFGG